MPATGGRGSGRSWMGVEFAPLGVPLGRRLETFVAAVHVSMFFLIPLACSLLFILSFATFLWPLSTCYATYLYLDLMVWKTPSRGGRRVESLRKSRWCRSFANYFPVTLSRSEELPADRNYLFGFHPHGVISSGAIASMAMDATGFSRIFPGLTSHLLTLRSNFFYPFVRDYILALGMCDVSRESLDHLLANPDGGNVAAVVVGGAAESLEASPGSYKLTLLRRRGFVKMALLTGCSLVPVFSFGENDLFLQPANEEGSRMRNFQNKFRNIFGFSPILFYGRGVFQYTLGFLPFRRPVHVVVGKAIAVRKTVNPSAAAIDEVHGGYIKGLIDLFEENKRHHSIPPDVALTII